MKLWSAASRCMVLVCLVATASCDSSERAVRGTVTVDGQPLHAGTIHFQPNESTTDKGLGAAVNEGQFELAAKLMPGSYDVLIEGFKKTGRIVTDPQRGKVEERIQMRFHEMPIRVALSSENADNVRIELKTAR